MVGLGEVFELPPPLGFDQGGGAGAEATVVDPGDVRVVVGEFGGDFGGSDEIWGKFRFFGDVGFGVAVDVVVRRGGHLGI
ncbi:hypothetical protein ACFX1T_033219 [Malus domestica]